MTINDERALIKCVISEVSGVLLDLLHLHVTNQIAEFH